MQRDCDRPGCAGKWTWSVAAQMEAFATKRPPPQGLCADCEGKLGKVYVKVAEPQAVEATTSGDGSVLGDSSVLG